LSTPTGFGVIGTRLVRCVTRAPAFA
jgi:hypothetical protein